MLWLYVTVINTRMFISMAFFWMNFECYHVERVSQPQLRFLVCSVVVKDLRLEDEDLGRH